MSSLPQEVAADFVRRLPIAGVELQLNVDMEQRGLERRRASSRFTERAFDVGPLDRRPIL
jgi:hypothetical protein